MSESLKKETRGEKIRRILPILKEMIQELEDEILKENLPKKNLLMGLWDGTELQIHQDPDGRACCKININAVRTTIFKGRHNELGFYLNRDDARRLLFVLGYYANKGEIAPASEVPQ